MVSRDQVLGAIRHVLTSTGGGWMVARGWAENAAAWETAAGAIAILIGFVWSAISPEKEKASGRGLGVLAVLAIAGSVALSACSLTVDDFKRISASERKLGESLSTIADKNVLNDALRVWNALAPENRTLEVEEDILFAANYAIKYAGDRSPITSVYLNSPIDSACARLPLLSDETKILAGC